MAINKKKCFDTSKLQNYLRLDPKERSQQTLNIFQVPSSMEFKGFFSKYLLQIHDDYTCKKEAIRDNIHIILEGQLNAYIPAPVNSQQDQTAPQKIRKKYIHTLNVGSCVNLLTACFKKITSFYFDCSENLTILNIPCVIDGISIITHIYPYVKSDYDFIFETLIQFDQFYTQQQVRDILFVSQKHNFKNGNIQLKRNGLIVFIQKGEFSIFKDFYKDNKLQKDSNSIQQYCKKEEDLQKNKNSQYDYNEDNDEDDLQTQKGNETLELQNLKMKFKKKDSQVFKRFKLGIKKPGALIVLARKDGSVDGIECQESEGIAFICTEEQYECITKEQDRKSDATQAQLLLKSETQIQNQSDQSDKKQNVQPQNNRSQISSNLHKNIQSKLPSSQEKISQNIQEKDEKDTNSQEQIDGEEDDTKLSLNSKLMSNKKDNSKGNMLRNKFELDYRKSLINSIGKQLNAFGNFFYASRQQQKQINLQQQQQQLQQGQQKPDLSSKIQKNQAERISLQPQNKQVESSTNKCILTEQDEEKLKEYLTPHQPQRKLTKKKTATLINPLQQSQKNTLRGSCSNIQFQIQENSQKNIALINRERSDSPPPYQENTLSRDTSIQKIDISKLSKHVEGVKLNRSKSAFQPSTPSSQSACNTPAKKLKHKNNGVQFTNTDSPSEDSASLSKFKKPISQKVNNFTPRSVPIIDLNGQSTQHHYSVSNYVDYNFLNTNNELNTPSQVNSPSVAIQGNQSNTFSDNYASIFSKLHTTKKSQHFIKAEQSASSYSTPINSKIQMQRKLETSNKNTVPIQLHKMRYKISETNGSYSHRQFSTNSIGDDQNSTLNFVNLSQYHIQKEKTNQTEQLPQKCASSNVINSLIHLPTQKTIANISVNEVSSNVIKFVDMRAQSAKSQRVQSARYNIDRTKQKSDLNIFKLNYDHSIQTPSGTNTITNKESLQNKNIMQILYPSKMKKLDKQTQIKTTKLQTKETDNQVIIPSSTTNKIKIEKSIEQEFQLFLQKKLRPQSTLNRTQGEKQINLLNKKVFGQYVQSLNNTPSNQKLLQQQQHLSNYQSPRVDQKTNYQQFQTFSLFSSQLYNKNKEN